MSENYGTLVSGQRYPSVRTAHFETLQQKELKGRGVSLSASNPRSSFFYPILYLSETRYAWGKPVGETIRVGSSLQDALMGLGGRFRAGSSFSIYFSLGFAFVPQTKRPDVNMCVRYESAGGYLQAPQKHTSQRDRLLTTLNELTNPLMTEVQAVDVANRIFGEIGRIDDGRLVFTKSSYGVCLFTPRKFLANEVLFFSNNLRRTNYCRGLTESCYLDANILINKGDRESEEFELTIL